MLARKFFKKALRKRVAPERILVIASRSNGFLKVRRHAWQAVKVHVTRSFSAPCWLTMLSAVLLLLHAGETCCKQQQLSISDLLIRSLVMTSLSGKVEVQPHTTLPGRGWQPSQVPDIQIIDSCPVWGMLQASLDQSYAGHRRQVLAGSSMHRGPLLHYAQAGAAAV